MSAIAAMALVPSCSVLEDRDDCPVRIRFTEEFNPHRVNGDMWFSAYEGGSALSQNYKASMDEYMTRAVVPSVRKGRSTVSFVEGVRVMTFESDSLLQIPYGNECDPVFAMKESFDTDLEEWYLRDSLLKQYARVKVNMVNKENVAYPYRLRVRGNVDGFMLRSLKPHEGRFYYIPEMRENSRFEFNVPRQYDNSLYLEVWGKENNALLEPETLLGIIRLGDYIALTDYNWNDRCLKDIELRLDFATLRMYIIVDDWEEGFSLTVTI